MSFGTNTKTGFSVRDILDLPDPTGRYGSGTEETEEDDPEEASVEVSGSELGQKLGFSGRRLCGCDGGSYGRWSRGSGNLHFSSQDLEVTLRSGLGLPLCAYSTLLQPAYGPERPGLPQQLAHMYHWS
ncbi:hypothetical protein FQN60_015477, partial [Etheostoma spectabile]